MEGRKVAVVAGGSGGIGEGIVAALLSAGHIVFVPTREGDHSDRLKAFVEHSEDLRTMPADLCIEKDVAAMGERIVSEFGHIDAVVVSVGADHFGYRLHRMPRADWDRSVQDNLLTHFNMQRVFVDQLRKQNHGTYIAMIGPEAESIRSDGGVISVMAAAQKMMARVIAQESFDSDIRVHSVTAHTTIKTRSRGEDANHDWITARDLGDYVTALVEGNVPGAQESRHELHDRSHVQKLLKRANKK